MDKYEIKFNNLEGSYILWLAMNMNKKPETIIKDIVLSHIAQTEMTVLISQLKKEAQQS